MSWYAINHKIDITYIKYAYDTCLMRLNDIITSLLASILEMTTKHNRKQTNLKLGVRFLVRRCAVRTVLKVKSMLL